MTTLYDGKCVILQQNLRDMGKLVINSYDEFAAHLGEELGASEWLQVDQERINLFADATLDHQWIHVDVERAKQESQYKSTIAHGYLTLSLLPYMWDQIIEVNNIKMLVNYGMDKMRFGLPVITGSRVRLVTKLHNIQNLRGICKAEIDFKIEIEGQRKPALEGIASFTCSTAQTTTRTSERGVQALSPLTMRRDSVERFITWSATTSARSSRMNSMVFQVTWVSASSATQTRSRLSSTLIWGVMPW